MIKIIEHRSELVEATCDKCGQDLMAHQDGNANYGCLKASFGWPSQLDSVSFEHDNGEEFHLCALCWTNCLEALGLLKQSEQLMLMVLHELATKRNRAEHLKY